MRARTGIKIDCLCLTGCNNPVPPLLRIPSRGTLFARSLRDFAQLSPRHGSSGRPALVLTFVEHFLLFGRKHRADLRHRVVH